jgi:hypothetical protein
VEARVADLLALSIQQPWAWLIAAGHKDIENRDWKPWNPGLKFRGSFLIHTGLRFDGPDDANEWAWPDINRPVDFDMGGIVGEAEIVGVVTESSSRWFYGPYGLVIRNAKRLPFRPCVGQLGFFRPDYSRVYAAPKPKIARVKKAAPKGLFDA